MMSLKSPVLFVSDAFSFYCFSCFYIFCICCHRMNRIFLMVSLTMIILTPGPMLRTLFLLFFVFHGFVGSVSGLGSVIFLPIGVNFKCDIFRLSYLYQ